MVMWGVLLVAIVSSHCSSCLIGISKTQLGEGGAEPARARKKRIIALLPFSVLASSNKISIMWKGSQVHSMEAEH